MSASLKSSSSCAPSPVGGGSWEMSEGDANDSTGSNNPPADGVEIWAGAEAAAARTSSGRNERIFQGSSAQQRVQYTMTQNQPINNNGKVPARRGGSSSTTGAGITEGRTGSAGSIASRAVSANQNPLTLNGQYHREPYGFWVNQ